MADYKHPLRVGVGGPVGSGKTALLEALCKAMRDTYHLAVVTNGIDIVGHHRQLPGVAHGFAEGFQPRGFSGADRAAAAAAPRLLNHVHTFS